MSTSLELFETLAFNARLEASVADWSLSYYFPGPDRRYNGTFLKIDSALIKQYIDGWQENWAEYNFLKSSTSLNSTFAAKGVLGMRIDSSGVHLHGLSVSSESGLHAMLAHLQHAQTRGESLCKQIRGRLGVVELSREKKIERFKLFKSGEVFSSSTDQRVIAELNDALKLVRLKMKVQITSCRFHVGNWFGNQAASEFMRDIRSNGLNVFNEQADFIISWRGMD